MILLIDNYDSFTYNLYQYMGIFREDIEVVRNDKITIEEICKMAPEKIVLSPGPKSPKEAGICCRMKMETFSWHIPFRQDWIIRVWDRNMHICVTVAEHSMYRSRIKRQWTH